MKPKRTLIHIPPTMWERLHAAAAKESAKQKQVITPAEYVRRIVNRHLKRKGI